VRGCRLVLILTILSLGATCNDDGGGSGSIGGTVSGSTGVTKVASIAGTWEFEALTGVPPADLPPGSVPDNRHDMVIEADGSFRWGSWSGHIDASGSGFALVVSRPMRLGQRFADYGASATITIVGDEMRIWLPDLGQDRDVDFGDAVEDIDSPDMAFRKADQ
jgi:hypothetical protein